MSVSAITDVPCPSKTAKNASSLCLISSGLIAENFKKERILTRVNIYTEKSENGVTLSS